MCSEWSRYCLACKQRIRRRQLASGLYDSAGYWAAGSPSRLTIPAGKSGIYRLLVTITGNQNADTSPYMIYASVYKNGAPSSNYDGPPAVSGHKPLNYIMNVNSLNAGDYLEVYLQQLFYSGTSNHKCYATLTKLDG